MLGIKNMLIDDVTIIAITGKGGNGTVAFAKGKNNKGPKGGNGGRGGDVYVRGVSQIDALRQFRHKKVLKAGNGKNGGNKLETGRNGEDLVLDVPKGTIIHNLTTQKRHEVENEDKILVAKGGRGGRGNFEFRSSVNTTPKESEEGGEGKEITLRFELKLIADVGFVGLPNVGKSTLLNTLTNANTKVANYPFTTLEPSLGVYKSLILADIPGLIEGASSGKGLGIKFLKHIERTKILFHFISAESENPKKDYEIIREELGNHNKDLIKKEEYVFLSKIDAVEEKQLKEKIKSLKTVSKKVIPFSILMDDTLKEVKKILDNISY